MGERIETAKGFAWRLLWIAIGIALAVLAGWLISLPIGWWFHSVDREGWTMVALFAGVVVWILVLLGLGVRDLWLDAREAVRQRPAPPQRETSKENP